MDSRDIDDLAAAALAPGQATEVVTGARHWRRRAVASGTAVVVLAGAWAAVAAISPTPRHTVHVISDASVPTVDLTLPPPVTVTGSTLPTIALVTTTTVRRRAVPRPTTTTGAATSSSTTSTTTAPACAASDLIVSTTTDHASYATGAAVTITVTVRNRSTHACNPPHAHMGGQVANVTDAGGNVVWTSPRGPMGALAMYEPGPPLAPGASYGYATAQWDQHACDATCAETDGGRLYEGPPVPTGNYHAVGMARTDDGPIADDSPASFSIGS